MGKRLWDLAKSRIEIGTILPGHRHKVRSQLFLIRLQSCDRDHMSAHVRYDLRFILILY